MLLPFLTVALEPSMTKMNRGDTPCQKLLVPDIERNVISEGGGNEKLPRGRLHLIVLGVLAGLIPPCAK